MLSWASTSLVGGTSSVCAGTLGVPRIKAGVDLESVVEESGLDATWDQETEDKSGSFLGGLKQLFKI